MEHLRILVFVLLTTLIFGLDDYEDYQGHVPLVGLDGVSRWSGILSSRSSLRGVTRSKQNLLSYEAKLLSNVVRLDQLNFVDSVKCSEDQTVITLLLLSPYDTSQWASGSVLVGDTRWGCSNRGRIVGIAALVLSVGSISSGGTVVLSTRPANISEIFEVVDISVLPISESSKVVRDDSGTFFYPLRQIDYRVGDVITISWNAPNCSTLSLYNTEPHLIYRTTFESWPVSNVSSISFTISSSLTSVFDFYFELEYNCFLGQCDVIDSSHFHVTSPSVSWNYDTIRRSALSPLNMYNATCKTLSSSSTIDSFCSHGGELSLSLDCSDCYAFASAKVTTLGLNLTSITALLSGQIHINIDLTLSASTQYETSGVIFQSRRPIEAIPSFTVLSVTFAFGLYLDSTVQYELLVSAEGNATAGFDGTIDVDAFVDTSNHIYTASMNRSLNAHPPTLTFAKGASYFDIGYEIGPAFEFIVGSTQLVNIGFATRPHANFSIEFDYPAFPATPTGAAPYPGASLTYPDSCGKSHYVEFNAIESVSAIFNISGSLVPDVMKVLEVASTPLTSGCLWKEDKKYGPIDLYFNLTLTRLNISDHVFILLLRYDLKMLFNDLALSSVNNISLYTRQGSNTTKASVWFSSIGNFDPSAYASNLSSYARDSSKIPNKSKLTVFRYLVSNSTTFVPPPTVPAIYCPPRYFTLSPQPACDPLQDWITYVSTPPPGTTGNIEYSCCLVYLGDRNNNPNCTCDLDLNSIDSYGRLWCQDRCILEDGPAYNPFFDCFVFDCPVRITCPSTCTPDSLNGCISQCVNTSGWKTPSTTSTSGNYSGGTCSGAWETPPSLQFTENSLVWRFKSINGVKPLCTSLIGSDDQFAPCIPEGVKVSAIVQVQGDIVGSYTCRSCSTTGGNYLVKSPWFDVSISILLPSACLGMTLVPSFGGDCPASIATSSITQALSSSHILANFQDHFRNSLNLNSLSSTSSCNGNSDSTSQVLVSNDAVYLSSISISATDSSRDLRRCSASESFPCPNGELYGVGQNTCCYSFSSSDPQLHAHLDLSFSSFDGSSFLDDLASLTGSSPSQFVPVGVISGSVYIHYAIVAGNTSDSRSKEVSQIIQSVTQQVQQGSLGRWNLTYLVYNSSLDVGVPYCGNGVLDDLEECDTESPGCVNCTTQSGWNCTDSGCYKIDDSTTSASPSSALSDSDSGLVLGISKSTIIIIIVSVLAGVILFIAGFVALGIYEKRRKSRKMDRSAVELSDVQINDS